MDSPADADVYRGSILNAASQSLGTYVEVG